MTLLQLLLIQVNLFAFYGFYLLLNAGIRHRIFNRIYLLVMPFAAVALPLVELNDTQEVTRWITELPAVSILREQPIIDHIGSFDLIFILYIAGVVLVGAFTLYQLIRAIRRPIAVLKTIYRGARVYELKEARTSYSFFRRIYLQPNELEDSETILLHEYAHVRGKHSLDLLLAACFRVLFWFNPVVYFWERRIRENHEFIADQYVLTHHLNARDYAHALFNAAFGIQNTPFVHSFSFAPKSLLRKRIENLKFKNQYHMKHYLIIPVLAGIGIVSISMNTRVESGILPTTENSRVLTEVGDPEKAAEFPGGFDALVKYIGEHVQYPEKLKKDKVGGIVYVSFEVAADGKVGNVKVARGSEHQALNDEAVRVVSGMPKWNPAEKDGKKVKSEMTLPFRFDL